MPDDRMRTPDKSPRETLTELDRHRNGRRRPDPLHGKGRKAGTRSGKIMLFILLGLSICILLCVVWLFPLIMVGSDRTATIRIPAGATEETVRDTLGKYLGPDYAGRVVRLSRLRNVDFATRTGMYTIQKGDNALVAMRKLTSGAQTPVRITINGFRSLPLLIDRISRKMAFPADSLRAVLEDPRFLAGYGLTPDQALALFIDDTYEVYWTASARATVEKIAQNYRYVWNQTRRNQVADLGLTPADIVTIASIVDEETNEEDEKGTIGRLYINRVLNNMKLQADPTVRFALGDFTIQRISKEDLHVDSPYNTYLHAGLPPGPIRTTSAATIYSILKAKPNSYLYMCAKEDFSGRHNFAESYDEHLRNAARYQAELDNRGITR